MQGPATCTHDTHKQPQRRRASAQRAACGAKHLLHVTCSRAAQINAPHMNSYPLLTGGAPRCRSRGRQTALTTWSPPAGTPARERRKAWAGVHAQQRRSQLKAGAPLHSAAAVRRAAQVRVSGLVERQRWRARGSRHRRITEGPGSGAGWRAWSCASCTAARRAATRLSPCLSSSSTCRRQALSGAVQRFNSRRARAQGRPAPAWRRPAPTSAGRTGPRAWPRPQSPRRGARSTPSSRRPQTFA